jgi:hypothetical protein
VLLERARRACGGHHAGTGRRTPFFARRKETRRALALVSACLGLFAILVPTSLIGTCGAEAMICNTTMKPIMMIAGGIAIAASVALLVVNELRRGGPAEMAAG